MGPGDIVFFVLFGAIYLLAWSLLLAPDWLVPGFLKEPLLRARQSLRFVNIGIPYFVFLMFGGMIIFSFVMQLGT